MLQPIVLNACIHWDHNTLSPVYTTEFKDAFEATKFARELKNALFTMVGKICQSISVEVTYPEGYPSDSDDSTDSEEPQEKELDDDPDRELE